MEITIEQNVYPNSGTKEATCKVKVVVGNRIPMIISDTYSIGKLGTCYQFYQVKGAFKIPYGSIELDGDIVLDPVNVQQEDWQLLKILNPDVDNKTWKIYYVLKDLIDNRVDEEYALERIKRILQKENKIEF